MRRCYECGAKCGISNSPYVLCPACRPEPMLSVATDEEGGTHWVDERDPAPVRRSGLIRAINLGALIGLGLLFVLIAAFLAAAYYAS